MTSKKAISPVMTTILLLVMMVVIFLVFFGFQRGAFIQQEVLLQQTAGQTGPLPCTKPPTVSIDPVTFIEPGVTDTVNLSASIDSSCFENLDVSWTFSEINGSTTTVETTCPYEYGYGYGILNNSTGFSPVNCTALNHTYYAATSNIWQIFPIKVSAFGLTSGFYQPADSAGFVKDPDFKLEKIPPRDPATPNPDFSDFSCVTLKFALRHTDPNSGRVTAITEPEKEGISLDVKDNSKSRDIESIVNVSNYELDLTYRAFGRTGDHKVEVAATKLYQTTDPLELDYIVDTSQSLYSRPEVAVFGGGNALGIYSTKSPYSPAPIDGSLFPNAGDHKDFTIADLNNDRIGEFVFLIDDIIFVQSYLDLKRSLSSELNTKSLDNLKRMWPSISLLGSGYKAIAASSTKVDSGNGIGNIVVIGPGELGLYKYSSVLGTITQVERGNDVPNFGNWKDVDLVDLNGDGKDEILALNAGGFMPGLGVFNYTDRGKLEEPTQLNGSTKYVRQLPQKSSGGTIGWNALAVGRYDRAYHAGVYYLAILGQNSDKNFICGSDFSASSGEVDAASLGMGSCDGYDNFACCRYFATYNRECWIDTDGDGTGDEKHSINLIDIAALPATSNTDEDSVAILYTDNSKYKILVSKIGDIFSGGCFPEVTGIDIPLNPSSTWKSLATGDVACI